MNYIEIDVWPTIVRYILSASATQNFGIEAKMLKFRYSQKVANNWIKLLFCFDVTT